MPVAPVVDRRRPLLQRRHFESRPAREAERRQRGVDPGGAIAGAVGVYDQNTCHRPVSVHCNAGSSDRNAGSSDWKTDQATQFGVAVQHRLSCDAPPICLAWRGSPPRLARGPCPLRKDLSHAPDPLAARPHAEAAALAAAVARGRDRPRPALPLSGLRQEPPVQRLPPRGAGMPELRRPARPRPRRRRAALFHHPDRRPHRHPGHADPATQSRTRRPG